MPRQCDYLVSTFRGACRQRQAQRWDCRRRQLAAIDDGVEQAAGKGGLSVAGVPSQGANAPRSPCPARNSSRHRIEGTHIKAGAAPGPHRVGRVCPLAADAATDPPPRVFAAGMRYKELSTACKGAGTGVCVCINRSILCRLELQLRGVE